MQRFVSQPFSVLFCQKLAVTVRHQGKKYTNLLSIALSVGLLTQALISRELNTLHKSEISSANNNIRFGLRTGPGRLPEPSTLPVSKKKHDYLQTKSYLR